MSVANPEVYHPYAVVYRDHSGNIREFCCYAESAYDARLQADELIGPDTLQKILAIRLEPEHFDW